MVGKQGAHAGDPARSDRCTWLGGRRPKAGQVCHLRDGTGDRARRVEAKDTAEYVLASTVRSGRRRASPSLTRCPRTVARGTSSTRPRPVAVGSRTQRPMTDSSPSRTNSPSSSTGTCRPTPATWTGSGITLDHLGDVPEKLDDCLELLKRPDLPHTLCNDVWRNLAGMILSQLERLESVEAVEAEAKAHEDFGEERCRVFVGRDNQVGGIAKYLQATEAQSLSVIGEPGSGKSALMAKAFAQAKAVHSKAFAAVRFIGATPGSSDGRSLLGSLCRQITRAYGGDESTVPTEYNDLAVEFGQRLELATAEQPLIVFLDALDQLGVTDPARALSWLPAGLPDHVRLVVSAVPGDCEGALRAKRPGPVFLTLDRMTRKEGKTTLAQWLKTAGRKLREHQYKEVLDRFEPEGRPLYLKLAFEEARLWPSMDEPGRRPLREGIPGIIRENLFYRLAEPASHGRMLVSHALGLLAASRHGLSEDELIDVLSADQAVKADFHPRSPKSPDVDRLPVVVWSRLYFDLEPYLSEHASEEASLLAFYHRQLDEAATQQFLAGGEGPARHTALAAYFRAKADAGADDRWELKARPLTELPFHLAGAGSDADLGADRCQTFHTWRPVIVSRVRFTSSSTITPLPIHIQPLAMLDWRSFLQKHLQRLSRHPASLLALVNHEGFAGAREQIATACWRGAWLRTAPEATPIPESERARAKGRGRGKHQIQQPSDDRGGGRATDRLLPGAPRHASRGRPGFDAGDQPNPRDRIGTPVGARVRARRQQSGRDARIGHRGLLPVSTGGRRVACGTRACDRAALPSARVQRPGPHLGLRCVLVPSGRRRAGAGVRRQLRGPGGASSDRADRRALGHGLLRNEASDRHQTRP